MAEPNSDRPSTEPAISKRLDSWKEIAAYLHRDVTTVRRWEKREGLPVHRHRHAALGSVYALVDEIEAWRNNREHPIQTVAPLSQGTIRPALVGRDAEMQRLHAHLAKAIAGSRQMVFVAGDLGVGKTALVQAFVDSAPPDVWCAAGQCVEHFGPAAPYLPIVDALGRLCRDHAHHDAVIAIERYAPSWLDQIHVSPQGHPRTRNRGALATGERMAGELAEAIDALSVARPLMLLLEDLHWSDHSTIELIARLGRRAGYARLLVIGTYRPAELFDSGSPLLRVCRELRAHFQAYEIELSLLTEQDVAALIARDRRWVDVHGAAAYLRKWSGNPLFLAHLIAHLERSGLIAEHAGGWALDATPRTPGVIPNTLRALVEEHVDRLDAGHHRLLEIASVVGEVFPTALVAAAAQQPVVDVERSFEDLRRRSHLVLHGDDAAWPDGTCSASYVFAHEFYRTAVYDRIPSAIVADMHRRVAERLETAFVDRPAAISSELAAHFDRGRDSARAVRYYGLAAENALSRSADREAQILLSRAAELLVRLQPDGPRTELEARLRAQLGNVTRALLLAHPWFSVQLREPSAVPDADRESPGLVEALIALSGFHAVGGDLLAAREIGDRAAAAARHTHDGRFEAVIQQAYVRLLAGEFALARSLSREALSIGEGNHAAESSSNRMLCLTLLAWSTWYLGLVNESRAAIEQIDSRPPASDVADHTTMPYASVVPILEWLGDDARALARCGPPPRRHAACGWLLARRRMADGLSQLRASIDDWRRLGKHAALPQALAWLAEALVLNGEPRDALAAAEQGLDAVRQTGVRCCDAELYRLRGEAIRACGTPGTTIDEGSHDVAEASFWAGITVARQQGAPTLELRVAISLARFLLDSGREGEARQILGATSEVLEASGPTPDLTAARALLRR